MPELAYVTAKVHGQVQGVFYRAFTSRLAKSLGLRGYVHNLPLSDAVEVHAEGEKGKLEELIKQLETGPPEALVENIEVDWSAFTGRFSNFEARY